MVPTCHGTFAIGAGTSVSCFLVRTWVAVHDKLNTRDFGKKRHEPHRIRCSKTIMTPLQKIPEPGKLMSSHYILHPPITYERLPNISQSRIIIEKNVGQTATQFIFCLLFCFICCCFYFWKRVTTIRRNLLVIFTLMLKYKIAMVTF